MDDRDQEIAIRGHGRERVEGLERAVARDVFELRQNERGLFCGGLEFGSDRMRARQISKCRLGMMTGIRIDSFTFLPQASAMVDGSRLRDELPERCQANHRLID